MLGVILVLGVLVGVILGVLDGLIVLVGVTLTVGVAVLVTVTLGVLVTDTLGVMVGVIEKLGVTERLGVGEGVLDRGKGPGMGPGRPVLLFFNSDCTAKGICLVLVLSL
jgi:hypothetical protein